MAEAGEERHDFLLAGEFHYFRIKKSLWKDGLAKLKAAGLNSISTYVPWIYHEPREGEFDFGELVDFIEACKEKELKLMVRPGPFIYAEYKGFGIPLWVGANYPESAAKKSGGIPHKGDFWFNYSHESPLFRGLVKIWYKNLVEAIKPYFGNPIISFQIDGETGLLYVNEMHNFLKRPFGFEEAIEWQASMEKSVCGYLLWLKDTARQSGVSVPIAHNDSAMHYSPARPAEKAKIADLHGYDFYNKVSSRNWTCDFPFGNSLYPEIFKNFSKDRPFYAFEIGMGWFDPRSKVKDEAIVQNIMGAAARGVEGVSLYIAHDCVEESGELYEYHTMLDKEGIPTPRYELVRNIAGFIRENEDDILNSEEVYDDIAYLYYYPNYRFVPDDYLPGEFLIDPVKYLSMLGHFGFYALLLVSGYNPRIIDIENISSEELRKFKAVIFPNKGYVDTVTYEKLKDYAAGGGNLLTTPVKPGKDINGMPFDASGLRARPVRNFISNGAHNIWDVKGKGRFWLCVRIFWDWIIKYKLFERRKIAKSHPTSMHIIDLFEPVLCAISAGFKPPSVLYATPGYYSIPEHRRKSYRDFAISLMEEFGIKRRFETDLEIEIVERRCKDGTLLFLFNRLGAQNGVIRLNAPARQMAGGDYRGLPSRLSQIRHLYSYKNSCARIVDGDKIEVAIEKDDVLVLKVK